ncbi:unnamed protein product [Cylicocyclus nassatus]|uniref:Uncharacterized protein n=1 Tax=Cylicocyclus nassatus TaxID=53992 RepID=A0AA36DSS5_CYLNA|nr:unnamed protein product [Cylicocyclus nassatus]
MIKWLILYEDRCPSDSKCSTQSTRVSPSISNPYASAIGYGQAFLLFSSIFLNIACAVDLRFQGLEHLQVNI